jgi:hypothetical protein
MALRDRLGNILAGKQFLLAEIDAIAKERQLLGHVAHFILLLGELAMSALDMSALNINALFISTHGMNALGINHLTIVNNINSKSQLTSTININARG